MPGSRREQNARSHRTTPAEPGSAPGRPLRVLIVLGTKLDQRLVSSWLARQPGFEVIDAPVDLPGVLGALRRRPPPDILLVEITPRVAATTPPIGDLKRACAGVPILAMAPHSESLCHMLRTGSDARPAGTDEELPFLDCLTLALIHGARGVIRRDAPPEQLCQALRALAAGQSWIPSDLSENLVRWARVASSGSRTAPLSPRETDVATRIAGGESNKEIARDLGLSESTAKKHVSQLLRKLHVADRLQLGLWLQHHAWLLNREEPTRASAERRTPRPAAARRSGP